MRSLSSFLILSNASEVDETTFHIHVDQFDVDALADVESVEVAHDLPSTTGR